MRYLLDTNAVIAMLNRASDADEKLISRAFRHRSEDVGTSSLVLHELYFGAYKSKKQERNLAVVEALRFPTVDFDPADAREAGRIRALLADGGTPIGPYDVLIAGQAARRGLILITANTREFSRVPNLKYEDWTR